MWLATPQTIDRSPLWEGPLEPAPAAEGERLVRRGGGLQLAGGDGLRDLPVLSIWPPEVWPLRDVYPPAEMPRLLAAKLRADDVYLARFACSLRPRRDEVQIEWARFWIRLAPDDSGRQPTVLDVHPQQVSREVQHHVKVTLSPSLKFKEVEAKFGGAEFGLEYTELQPLISAAGEDATSVSWDYEAVAGRRLEGIKWMHLLLKSPRGMPRAQAQLDLTADARVRELRLPVLARWGRKSVDQTLSVQLWGP